MVGSSRCATSSVHLPEQRGAAPRSDGHLIVMSMLWAWDRILGDRDRVEKDQRAEEQARAPRDEDEGDPPSRTCRVCKHEGLESYCPNCLADTMVANKRTAKKR